MRTSMLAIFALLLIPLSSVLALPGPHHSYAARHLRKRAEATPLDDLYKILNSTPKESNIQSFARYYASGNHLAGKNYSQALWTKQKWEEYGVQAEIVSYDIYLNYHKQTRLALLKKAGPNTFAYTTLYEAQLQEDVLPEDPTTGFPDRVPSFHGYSASGNVTGQLVFANYGTVEDYQYLASQGIDIKGKIVLVKYGKVFRGLKVHKAQERGAIGVVIYSDPGDDGNTTEKNGLKPYPEGPARQPSSVQKGSVLHLANGVGDPTTPGYASKPGVKRVNPEKQIPKIPSLPLSYRDAIPFLKALEGNGLDISKLDNEAWKRGGLDYKGVKYFTGPTNSSIVVNLFNDQEYVTTPVWDVIGTIPGQLKDEVVMIGNHRDAWSIGGSIDPNGASACLVELARTLQVMRKKGWVPQRTLMMGSWDAEEYGIIGSTEWVEEYASTLNKTMVAYLNMDGAPLGPSIYLMAHPLLRNAIEAASKRITNIATGQPIFDSWGGEIDPIASGSDFTAFQTTIGIPSMELLFDPDSSTQPAVYHYHSNYDSIAWTEKFGDPGYKFHGQATKMWGALLLEMSESPIILFKTTHYATSLLSTIAELSTALKESPDASSPAAKVFSSSLETLKSTAQKFSAAAEKMDQLTAKLLAKDQEEVPVDGDIEAEDKKKKAIAVLNAALLQLDRKFIYEPGLDNRTFYKHVINGPSRYDGYSTVLMPGLAESIEDANWTNGSRWAEIIGKCIAAATALLEGAVSAAGKV